MRADVEAAEGAASRILTPLPLATPEELRDSLVDIAAFRGADVRIALMDGLSGRLVRKKSGRSTITVNGREGEERRRFSLGHELGHHELHLGINQTFACTSADMDDYKRSPLEREANYFAAAILMPPLMFLDAVDDEPPSISAVRRVAPRFGTSLTATALRLNSLTDERSAVVMSSKDGVVWAFPNNRFGFAIDKRLPRLSPHSYAYDVLRDEPAQERPSEVDGGTWLYFDLRDGLRLFESSILLGAHGLALTILWIKDQQ